MGFTSGHQRRLTRRTHSVYHSAGRRDATPNTGFQDMKDLDLMILNGWGDTPQNKLPADWRERRKGRRNLAPVQDLAP